METHELTVETGGRWTSDLTGRLRDVVRGAGLTGLVHVFLPHATAGLALIETGSGTEPDLGEAIERLLPRDDRYRHAHGSTGHGADHVLPAFVAPTLTLAAEGGELVLGTWQSVVLVDTNVDNPVRTVQVRLLEG